MDVQERNSTRIYALSAGPTLPEWMGERARRNLSKRDSNIRRRIELLQDFQMPVASTKIIQSKNGNYLMAAGTYSPRIRCYELEELSMKFERILDTDIMDLCFVGASEDYGKVAILQADRTIQFHAPYGHHASIRIPTFGRSMAYEPTTCELLVACSPKSGSSSHSGGQVYRFNLEEGRFATPLPFHTTNSSKDKDQTCGASCISISPTHALTALGCDDGLVRFWDNRMSTNENQQPFVHLDVKSSTAGFGYSSNPQDNDAIYNLNAGHEITSLAFDTATGMNLAVGTHGGNVALYDMRSSKPLHVKEHQYGLPIHTVQFHSASNTVLSADAKLVKIWRAKPSSSTTTLILEQEEEEDDHDNRNEAKNANGVGSIVSNIEGAGDFTHFITAGDETDPTGNSSGLVLCAGEQPKMQAFYCPALGAAPRWCSFLDNITEELEEHDHNEAGNDKLGTSTDMMTGKATGTIYEDYKFLTRSEIDELGIQNLVGTPLLRGYMHGFFIDIGLYNRVRAVANPFEYEEYRKDKIRKKMEEKRASLIAPKNNNKKKKVNSALAERLEDKATGTKSSGKAAKTLLADDRFGSLFTNPDFEIDEEDIDFKLRNPSGVAKKKKQRQAEEMDSESDNDNDEWDHNDDASDSDNDSHSDDDSVKEGKVRGEMYEQMKEMERNMKRQKKNKDRGPKKKKKMLMYETEDNELDIGLGDTSTKYKKGNTKQRQQHMSLEKRLAEQKETGKRVQNVKTEGASREVSFIPKDTLEKRKKLEEQRQMDSSAHRNSKRDRRGIKDLRLKTPFKNQ